MPDGRLRCQPTQGRGFVGLGARNCVAMLPAMEAITTVWLVKPEAPRGAESIDIMRRAIEEDGARPGSLIGECLEVARALALKPRLLILDEPAAGMNPAEKDRVRDLIQKLNADGRWSQRHQLRREKRLHLAGCNPPRCTGAAGRSAAATHIPERHRPVRRTRRLAASCPGAQGAEHHGTVRDAREAARARCG